MNYIFSHSNFSFDVWVPVALLILAAAIALAVISHVKKKKKLNALNTEITDLYMEDAMEEDSSESKTK